MRLLCSIDGGLEWEETVNLLAEILDNTEPTHTRSRLVLREAQGMKHQGNRWVEDIGRVWVYYWDDFEAEWGLA